MPIINDSRRSSFMVKSSTHTQLYILGRFSSEEMNELTGNLGEHIFSLPICPEYKASYNLTSPYDTSKIKNPIIDIFIDSYGGAENALLNISTLLNIAKSRGTIIRTTVLSCAYSAGSLLAIQGTPGFRIMGHDTQHMIHFGSTSMNATNPDDIEIRAHQIARQKKKVQEKYKTHTKIPTRKLENMMRCESGYLTAQECLEMGVCDWILNEKGKFINLQQQAKQKTK